MTIYQSVTYEVSPKLSDEHWKELKYLMNKKVRRHNNPDKFFISCPNVSLQSEKVEDFLLGKDYFIVRNFLSNPLAWQ